MALLAFASPAEAAPAESGPASIALYAADAFARLSADPVMTAGAMGNVVYVATLFGIDPI